MRDSSFILRELEQQLLGSLDRPAELGGLLQSFLHGADATALLNELLASYCSGSWDARTLVRFDGQSFLLLQNERFTVSLKLLTKRSEMLHTSGIDRLTVFRSLSPVTVEQYRIVGHFNPDIFDPGATLEPVSSSLSDGSPVFQARLEPLVYDWHSPEPMVIAQLVRYPASSQLWFFHRQTLRAAFPVVGFMELSSYVLLSRMLAALDEKRALRMLEELAGNDSHIVRWAAIQAIGKLDGNAGRDYLQRSLTDKHPHISSAAAKTLAKLAE